MLQWTVTWASAHRGKLGQLTPWRNGWKIKKRNHAKKAVFWIFWEQLGQAGVEKGAMLTTYLFKYTLCIKPSVLWRCWLGGRKGIRPVKTERWGAGVVSVWSKVQTYIWPSWCHRHSLSLASVKSRLVFPFWYWLTRVVPDKGPLSGCVCGTYHSKSHPADEKYFLKGAWSGWSNPFLEYYTPCNISTTANARDFKFCKF